MFLDFDPEDGIPAGRNWEQELYRRVRGCRAVVVVCSRHSMAARWCFMEITHARALGKHLFPVKVDDCELFFGRDDETGDGLDLLNHVERLGERGLVMVLAPRAAASRRWCAPVCCRGCAATPTAGWWSTRSGPASGWQIEAVDAAYPI